MLHLAVNGRVWARFCCACDTCLGYVYLAAHSHVQGLKKWLLVSLRRGCLQSPARGDLEILGNRCLLPEADTE